MVTVLLVECVVLKRLNGSLAERVKAQSDLLSQRAENNQGGRGVNPTCRHCGRRSTGLRRSLCFACYADPAIRAVYPPGKRGPVATKPRRNRPGEPLRAPTLLEQLNDFDAVL